MPNEPRGKVSNEENSPPLPSKSCSTSRDENTLQAVICQNDPVTFDYFAKHNIALNYPNRCGKTPLLKAIRCRCSPACIKRLFELGCDVNIPDKIGRTPLHVAILNRDMDIAHKLIEHDADLDVQDLVAKETPLFYAIKSNNIEAVCMLLCYGADVTVQNTDNYTPLTFAMDNDKQDIVLILLDYCDDFNYRDKEGYMPLHLAMMQCDLDLTMRLIDAGADVNVVTNGCCLLEYAIEYSEADVFKKIWSRMNVDLMLQTRNPLLLTYNSSWRYSDTEWVECLYLMFESSVFLDLMDQCMERCGFITSLVERLCRGDVEWEDRQNIINICLTLGAEVTVADLDAAIELFGYEEEFTTLIYATEHYRSDSIRHPLLRLIIGLSDFNLLDMRYWYRNYIEDLRAREKNVDSNDVMIRLGFFSGCFNQIQLQDSLVSCLGFFSLTPCWKEELLQDCYWTHHDHKLVEKIKAAREFPSLLELSRNRVHSLVRETCKVQKPYQFPDALKRLPLPETMIDLLLFKSPIYE